MDHGDWMNDLAKQPMTHRVVALHKKNASFD